MKNNRIYALALLVFSCCASINAQAAKDAELLKYKLLATIKTSTMQKEIDQVSAQGYRILVGSPTSEAEMAVFLSRDGTAELPYKYKLLATTRTGTMQKELNEAANGGFRLMPSTMIAKKQLLGAAEIVMIMERPPKVVKEYEYKLLATSLTSTLQKEVTEAETAGFAIVGMVSRGEHMVVMERSKDARTP
jgi:hypothetical protein